MGGTATTRSSHCSEFENDKHGTCFSYFSLVNKTISVNQKKSFASFCQGVVKKPSCKLNGRTYSGSFWKLLNLRNDTSFSFVSLSPRKIKMLRIEINVVYVQYMQVIMYNQKWRYKICKRTSPNSFLKLCKR